MGILPATGTAISMGIAGKAYYGPTNASPTNVTTSIGSSVARSLNAKISRGNITTAFSSVFGGRTTPFTYP